jgi:hypothetical protein
MVKRAPLRIRWLEAPLAAGLLLSYFMPWIYSLGEPVAAHGIRERLAGPHRLLSSFDPGSRVSLDYTLSAGLHAIPVLAGLVLFLILARKYRPWAGAAAGCLAVAAFVFLKGEMEGVPFHRLAAGAYLAAVSGTALALAAGFRQFSRH